MIATAVFSFDKDVKVTSESAGTNDLTLRFMARHESLSLLLTAEQAQVVINALAAAAMLKGRA